MFSKQQMGHLSENRIQEICCTLLVEVSHSRCFSSQSRGGGGGKAQVGMVTADRRYGRGGGEEIEAELSGTNRKRGASKLNGERDRRVALRGFT